MKPRAYLIGWYLRHYLPGVYITAQQARRWMMQQREQRLIRAGCLAQAGALVLRECEVTAAILRTKKAAGRR